MTPGPLRNAADGRVHFSDLVHMARSPKHYKHNVTHPKKTTQPMIVGAAADALIFGVRNVSVYPGKVRNGKEWEAFRDSHLDDIVVIQSEYDEAAGVAQSVLSDPVAGLALEGCEIQMTGQWEWNGMPWATGVPGQRGGFDAVNLGPSARQLDEMGISGAYVFDLKRTISGDANALMWHARKRLWHAQMAAYVDGLQAMGHDIRHALLGCAEGSAPHDVTVIVLDESTLNEGRKCISIWTETLKQCEATGHWPGRHQSAVRWEWQEWGGMDEEEGDDDE